MYTKNRKRTGAVAGRCVSGTRALSCVARKKMTLQPRRERARGSASKQKVRKKTKKHTHVQPQQKNTEEKTRQQNSSTPPPPPTHTQPCSIRQNYKQVKSTQRDS